MPDALAAALLDQLRGFALPGGADVRGVRGIQTTEAGEIRSAPGARWIPFTAEQTIDATRSAFHWEARLRTGPVRALVVTDAYEDGHGRASVTLGGVVPLASSSGVELDRGEIQRYLALLPQCPPALFNHPTLEWTRLGATVLRVADRADPSAAVVDLELDASGRPLCVRADRPRTVGRRTVTTPWSGFYGDFEERDGLCVPTRVEVVWHLPEGDFTYYRGVTTSLAQR